MSDNTMSLLKLFLFLSSILCACGQSTETATNTPETSTVSAEDIYNLNEEDFKLWLSGGNPKAWETSTPRVTTTTMSSTDNSVFTEQTTPRQEEITPQQPIIPTAPGPVTDNTDQGYFYHRVEDIASQITPLGPEGNYPDNQIIRIPLVGVAHHTQIVYNDQQQRWRQQQQHQHQQQEHNHRQHHQQQSFWNNPQLNAVFLNQNQPQQQHQQFQHHQYQFPQFNTAVVSQQVPQPYYYGPPTSYGTGFANSFAVNHY
ncbi:TOX high mobility group box family member 3-like [Toxorhynchites rutilus septentrionalis]|uniref:TOX high mobility group box family member 3-like n=1 Tax=Toxorhynchites rutilus septentrionalis TaxID=329112 RepID=UPI0024795652|nr:TOX high mobility group box family member 3-like [Toxorhynchites rutilus septentrionalis]